MIQQARSKISYKLSVFLILLITLGVLLALVKANNSLFSLVRFSPSTFTPTPTNPYAPAKYGLPDTLAGYKVLAVLTSETLECLQTGKKRLILQASQGSLDEYLKANDQAALETAMRESGLIIDDVEVQIVGPTVTLDGILSETQKWNQLSKNGCVQSGPIPN